MGDDLNNTFDEHSAQQSSPNRENEDCQSSTAKTAKTQTETPDIEKPQKITDENTTDTNNHLKSDRIKLNKLNKTDKRLPPIHTSQMLALGGENAEMMLEAVEAMEPGAEKEKARAALKQAYTEVLADETDETDETSTKDD